DPDRRFQTAGEFRDAIVALGYAEHGAMRRTTDPGARAATSSHAEKATLTGAPTAPVFKETRLAPPAAAQVIKETRLGNGISSESAAYATEPDAPSFLSKLTWVHYAIAGS